MGMDDAQLKKLYDDTHTMLRVNGLAAEAADLIASLAMRVRQLELAARPELEFNEESEAQPDAIDKS